MKKDRQDISSNVVNVRIPESWEQLSQPELSRALHLLASELPTDLCRARLFSEYMEFKFLSQQQESTDENGDCVEGGYWVSYPLPPVSLAGRKKKRSMGRERKDRKSLVVGFVSYRELAMAYEKLSWFGNPPLSPVRPDKIGGVDALPARLQGVPFETFLACESLFQGYIHTEDEKLVRRMAQLLYPGLPDKSVDGYVITACFMWFSGLKTWLQARYPNFFRPAGAGSDIDSPEMPDMGNIIRTQVRALTKGDVTKNALVLSAELHDALHELDALAAEYERVKSDSKK